jgi:DNA-binding NarL/FixJ family response regulator
MTGLRVLIAEDHERLRQMVVALLHEDFKVIADVGDGDQLVRAATALNPDVIVSDIDMPLIDGFSARKELLSMGIEQPFVFISMMDLTGLPSEFREGAVGYVHKADLSGELAPAIRAVAGGQFYVSRSYRKQISDP